jgi:soluble lytic murein transglycosylase-like protein
MFRSVALAAALAVLTPSVASAQIYAWRDASGRLVLSDQPKDASAKTYAVPKASGFLVTKAAPGGRAALYDETIEVEANRNALSPDFVKAVIQAESGFNPRARSRKGAMGLMQLMPETAAEYGVLNPYNPNDNIRAGVAYLRSLIDRYNDDETLALAAYNAGPGAVARYDGVPPYRETRAYVARVKSHAEHANPGPRTRLYRTVEIVDGHEVVHFSDKRTPGAELVKVQGIR